MEKEFQEIIQKNLPAQVGEALRARLIIADNAEKEIPQLKEQIERLKATVKDQDSRIISQNELEYAIGTQTAQLEAIKEERRNLEVEKLKIQLEAEKDKSGFAKSVALGLVRNQEFRTSLSGSSNSNDGRGCYSSGGQNTMETKTVE